MTDERTTTSKRRWLIIGGLAVAAVAALFAVSNLAASLVSSSGVEPGQPVTITVTPGTPASTIYGQLADAGVVAYGDIEAAATAADAENRIQPGTYALVTGMEAQEVLRLLLEGDTTTDSRAITIVEGWTIDRILEELTDATEYQREDFEAALTSGAVESGIRPAVPGSVTGVQAWEGLLYPARYEIPVGISAAGILQTMADEMVNRFESADWSNLESTGLSRYEILTLASLIEREAGTDADRPLISSVLHNRLAVPMRLQIDATVIYALGSNPGRVTADDLKIDSPYNTYQNDGLPPTPIGTVSAASLTAALNPADTDFLFYVLTDTDGSHAFAVSYEEHQENVEDAKDRGVLP